MKQLFEEDYFEEKDFELNQIIENLFDEIDEEFFNLVEIIIEEEIN